MFVNVAQTAHEIIGEATVIMKGLGDPLMESELESISGHPGDSAEAGSGDGAQERNDVAS